VGAAALGAAFMVVAAGCGQSGAPGSEGDQHFEIKTVADSTQAAGTARYEGSYQPSGRKGPGRGRFEGEIDFDHDRSAVRARSDAYEGLPAQESETRSIDGYLYLHSPPRPPDPVGEPAAPAMPTTPWTRMRFPGSRAALLPMGSSGDVTGYLDALESMGAGTEVVGTETVRGVATTRYRVTPGVPPKVPAQVDALDHFSFDTSGEGSVDLWADAQGRLRRFRSESRGSDSEAGDGGSDSKGSGVYEFEVFDYGAPVTIEAPPPDQVTTLPFGSAEPGDYRLVASGSSDGSSWKIFTAPRDDGRCLAVEADVPAYVSLMRGSDDGRVDLGCSSSASSSSVATGGDPNGVVTHVDLTEPADPEALPLADGRALLVSEVPDGTTGVTLRLRAGGTKSATPMGGWFGAVLGHDEVAEVLEFATPSGTKQCRLKDGFGYTCESDGFDASSSSSSSSSSSGSSSSAVTSTVPPATTAR
jgi:hypothetical protein